METAPWFVWLILEAVGVLFIASGIPLARRRVPPNLVYGVRFTATLADDAVWYEVNAKGGRHFIAIGIAHLMLLNALLISPRVGEMTTIVVALTFCVSAPVIDAIVLHRMASRLAASSGTTSVPSNGASQSRPGRHSI